MCVAPADLWDAVGEAEGSPAFLSELQSAAGYVSRRDRHLSTHTGRPEREGETAKNEFLNKRFCHLSTKIPKKSYIKTLR